MMHFSLQWKPYTPSLFCKDAHVIETMFPIGQIIMLTSIFYRIHGYTLEHEKIAKEKGMQNHIYILEYILCRIQESLNFALQKFNA